MTDSTTSLGTTFIAVRGVVMIVAAALAFGYPNEAVRFAVLVGGGILLLDGVLNLASLNFRDGRQIHLGIGLLRSVSAMLAGLLIVFSPWLLSILSVELLRWLIGLQAIVVGLIEALTPLIESASTRRPGRSTSLWGYVMSGAAYALFGLAIIVIPQSAAADLARVIAVLMIVYAASLFVRSWRHRSAQRVT